MNKTSRGWAWCNKPGTSLILFLLLFSAVSPIWAESEALRVRGTGIAEGDHFDVRRKALENAFQNVVQQFLDAKIAHPDPAMTRRILRSAESYVPAGGYTVVRQDQDTDGVTITIEAALDEEALEYDITKIMLRALPTPPSILFVIAEDIQGTRRLSTRKQGAAQRAFDERFENFTVTAHSPEELLEFYGESQLVDAVYGDVTATAEIARAALTDTVVTGRVTVTAQATTQSAAMMEYTAQAALRVYRASDGKMLDDINSKAIVLSQPENSGAAQAIEDACNKLIGPAIVASVMTVLGEPTEDRVLITVESPQSHENVETIKNALARGAEVYALEELFYTDRRARLRIAYDGPMSYLSDMLRGIPMDGGTLMVQRAVGRSMTLSLR